MRNKRKGNPLNYSSRRRNMHWMNGIRDGGSGLAPRDLFGVPKGLRRMYELGYIHGKMERVNFCKTMGSVA